MASRILVADDDRALQILLNVILTRAGFEVEFANTARDAIRKASADSYDAIMLDLIFPDLRGVELLDRLEHELPGSLKKTIVLTGAGRSILDKIDPTRVHALLRKPLDIQDVIRLTVECAREA